MNERIKKIREYFHLNQRDFAKKIDVGQSTLAMFETGNRTAKDIHVNRICTEFNISEEWLRNGNGEMFDTALQKKAEENQKIKKIMDANLSMKEMDLLLELIKQFRKDG